MADFNDEKNKLYFIFDQEVKDYKELQNKQIKLGDEYCILNDILNILDGSDQDLDENIGGLEMLINIINSDNPKIGEIHTKKIHYMNSAFKNFDFMDDYYANAVEMFDELFDYYTKLKYQKEIQLRNVVFELDAKESHFGICKYIAKALFNDYIIKNSMYKDFSNILVKHGYNKEDTKKLFEQVNLSADTADMKHKIINNNLIRMMESKHTPLTIDYMEKTEYSMNVDYRLNSFEKHLNEILKKYPARHLADVVEGYTNTLVEDLDYDELHYFYKLIINYLISLIKDDNELISDDDSYIEFKNEVAFDYYKHEVLLQLFEKKLKASEVEHAKVALEEYNNEPENDIVKNTLLFTDEQITRDLKSVNEESYKDILRLLHDLEIERFTHSNRKQFVSNSQLKGYSEMRNDQIRIVYKYLYDNYYEILGILQKKQNNDREDYVKLANRFKQVDNQKELDTLISKSENIKTVL